MDDYGFMSETTFLKHATLTFECEVHPGCEPRDTRVLINGELLCWITWEDRNKFLNELFHTVDEYSI